jgi:hypothetical protein
MVGTCPPASPFFEFTELLSHFFSLERKVATNDADRPGDAVVLVHGNPETTALWDLLVEQLVEQGHDKPLCLSPPGFGAPVPTGWGATVGEYRDWLVAELERVGRVGTDEQRRRAAARAGARVEVLDGLGHWWMTRDPERGAAVLTRFWASL